MMLDCDAIYDEVAANLESFLDAFTVDDIKQFACNDFSRTHGVKEVTQDIDQYLKHEYGPIAGCLEEIFANAIAENQDANERLRELDMLETREACEAEVDYAMALMNDVSLSEISDGGDRRLFFCYIIMALAPAAFVILFLFVGFVVSMESIKFVCQNFTFMMDEESKAWCKKW